MIDIHSNNIRDRYGTMVTDPFFHILFLVAATISINGTATAITAPTLKHRRRSTGMTSNVQFRGTDHFITIRSGCILHESVYHFFCLGGAKQEQQQERRDHNKN
jgi:hypothetical protein